MSKTILEVEAVSKTYQQGSKTIKALNDVSLKVAQGEIYGIIGLSGAGKSTLLRILAGLIQPSQGKVLFHSQDINRFNTYERVQFRLKIGMIFQNFNLLSSRTVYGNIAYPLEIAKVSTQEQKKRIDELLALVGLEAKKEAYPASLSGGEKQRVGIARALAANPEILFCDEATSALDPKTTKEILELLKSVNKKLGVTIVLITHDMDVIKRICHKVAVIEAGSIVEEGQVSHLFAEPQHPTTKQFLQGTGYEIPTSFLKPLSNERQLLRLKFKGSAAGDPLISHIIKKYHVDANILLGWIDHLQTTTIGTLVIELTGTAEGISGALNYLKENKVHHELLNG